MPTVSGRQSIAIGVVVANVLLGSQYELAPFDGTIEIGLFSTRSLVTCFIASGPDILQEPGGLIPFGAEAMPVYPDHYHWEDEVAQSDRLKISLTNGNAAAGPDFVNWALRISPA